MVLLACSVYAAEVESDNSLTSTSINNNYLGFGNQKEVQRNETEVNSHLQPMNTPVTVSPDYTGPVFQDHKIQTEILNFLLRENRLKSFRIERNGIFEINSAKTNSMPTIGNKKYKKQRVVYVFRDLEDFEKIENSEMVGYVDTFSKGRATLIDCFNQAVVDSGAMGGNILVILKTNFLAELKAKTIGLGTSGAAGFLHGGAGANVYGGAIGYASSQATPQTNPYLHGIVLFSQDLIRK